MDKNDIRVQEKPPERVSVFKFILHAFAFMLLIGSLQAAGWTSDGNGGVYWSENGYTISAYPATSFSNDDHEQYVNFTSSNPTPITVNLSFVFDAMPSSGAIYLKVNKTIREQFSFTVYGVINYSATTLPCQIGDAQNAMKFNVTYNRGYGLRSYIMCFDNFTQSGSDYNLVVSQNKTLEWENILNNFHYSQVGNKHVWTIDNVNFTQGTNYQTKFVYRVGGSGKFDIYAHQNGVDNPNILVQLDPWYATYTGTATTIIDGGVNYTIVTFTSNGTFNVSGAAGNINATVLVVAGGGGGGASRGGGGGAGGLQYNTSINLTAGTNYSIIIGAGGAGGTTTADGTGGVNSSLGVLINAKGGGGGAGDGGNGVAGGSGGGAGDPGTGGNGTAGQGNNGATVSIGAGNSPAGGGGGSNSSGGVPPDSNTSGMGGNGMEYSINGTATRYAAGGGGGCISFTGDLYCLGGDGGLGGGGKGGNISLGDTAAANTGSGGGGGGNNNGVPMAGGAGASGRVIIRYETYQNTTTTANLTALCGTGGASCLGNSSNFTTPANKTINATASAGYYFSNWSVTAGNCTITNASNSSTFAEFLSTTLTCTIQASFINTTANLTVSCATGGASCLGSESGFITPANKTINATPSSNYNFTNWSITSGNCTLVNASSNETTAIFLNTTLECTVTANFISTANITYGIDYANITPSPVLTSGSAVCSYYHNTTNTSNVSVSYEWYNDFYLIASGNLVIAPSILTVVSSINNSSFSYNDLLLCQVKVNGGSWVPSSVVVVRNSPTSITTYSVPALMSMFWDAWAWIFIPIFCVGIGYIVFQPQLHTTMLAAGSLLFVAFALTASANATYMPFIYEAIGAFALGLILRFSGSK